jgi:cytochrome c-type biogenesis protein CcmH
MVAGGFVTDEALAAFDATLAKNPDDPRARFFKGLALDQSGDGAISLWIDMVNMAQADADWAPDLRRRITAREAEAGVDIEGRLAAPATASIAFAQGGPTADQVRGAMELPAADRQAMIESMVAGLAARLKENPDDADGWIRLIRSKMVLGRDAEAADDLRAALDVFATAPETSARILAEARSLGVRVE